MYVSIQMPGPFLVASIGTAAVLGASAVWYTYPSHREMSHQKVHELAAVAHDLQGRLFGQVGLSESAAMTTVEAENAKISSWFHRFDRDGSGGVSANEIVDTLDKDGDGHLSPPETHSFIGDAIADFLHVRTVRSRTLAVITFLTTLAIGLVTLIAFYHSRRQGRTKARLSADVGTFEITALRCRDLVDLTKENEKDKPQKRQATSNDPYIEVDVGGTRRTTSVKKHQSSPTFSPEELKDMHFAVDLKDKKRGKDTISLHVWGDKAGPSHMLGMYHEPQSMGHAQLRISEVFASRSGKEVTKSEPLVIDHIDNGPVRQERVGSISITGVYKPSLRKGA